MTIGKLTADALAELKAQGKRYGQIPFGKMVTLEGLVDCPEEREIIDRIKALRYDGLSYQQVADNLNLDGYTIRDGQQFNKQRIYDILKAAMT